jgi:HAE1 family hydrophobic/amphiphilic exporter-1
MTSFAFLLGVLPLVTATGAGANARRSLGISTFSGMVASTCLAVLFVPSFFVVMQRLEERRRAKRTEPAGAAGSPAKSRDEPIHGQSAEGGQLDSTVSAG